MDIPVPGPVSDVTETTALDATMSHGNPMTLSVLEFYIRQSPEPARV
jgi:hypothetical protein